MGKTLSEIALELKDSKEKIQLIYAFNGTGKTRLSREFKSLFKPDGDSEAESGLINKKIIYYNAFTEDLFYWDNDLLNNIEPKLKIQQNDFTKWIFEDQGQETNIISHFQHYTNEKLTPHFNPMYKIIDTDGNERIVPAFSEVKFSYERGNDDDSEKIKISKGEESCFIWSVFYSLFEQVVEVLNVPEKNDRETNQFDDLEYVFIDDPVTSLDENHLIELAVNLAVIIKRSTSNLKFIITTHNPLFYNVLSNEFKNDNKQTGFKSNKHFKKKRLTKSESEDFELHNSNDSPFSYHLLLLDEIREAIETGQVYKYHFAFLRNILEKTATFLGYCEWKTLLDPIEGDQNAYFNRILNLANHSKHSAEETVMVTDENKRILKYLIREISSIYKFYSK